MRFRTLCFGIIGLCLFAAGRAITRPTDMIPAPPGAGMSGALGRDSGPSNPDGGTRNPRNQRLRNYAEDFKSAYKNNDDAQQALNKRDEVLKKTDDETNSSHTPGTTKVNGANQADGDYEKIRKSRDDAWDAMMDAVNKMHSEMENVKSQK